jgi:BMFP domain-containing protein YqiC
MTTPSSDRPPSDPFVLWRQIYEANERAWSTALERAMNSPAFAETQGKVLETFLQAQRAVRDQMRSYLEAVNVPTREDIARLGELIVGLEEKVDRLEDRLGSLEQSLREQSARDQAGSRAASSSTPRAASPRAASPRAASPRAASPRAASPTAAAPRRGGRRRSSG